MSTQMIFQRYETKYMLTKEQKERILEAMSLHMALDEYGRTTIRNLYYDTGDYLLARRSIDKPEYKEKLRVRSYGPAGEKDKVFVELKKKYDSVVYKRRLTLTAENAREWLAGREDVQNESQIAREIAYFRDHYETLEPRVYLSYEREAWYDLDGSDFRITFDENILARRSRLSLAEEPGGEVLLKTGTTLMEVKCAGGYPLWLVQVLSREHIRKTSFSKYGMFYEKVIFPELWPAVVKSPALSRQPENKPVWTMSRRIAHSA